MQTIENVRNRTQVELVHKEEKFIKLMSKPNVESFQRFNEDLVAVKLGQTRLKLIRPIYAGMVILDLAKLLMYDFYYGVLKEIYGDKMDLIFTDTDSLCVKLQTYDVYEDFKLMDEELDFSDYPTDHDCYNEENKKVLGKFKDEMNGDIIEEVVGLRSKMYSIKWDKGTALTLKGISRTVKQKVIKHEMYSHTLFNGVQRIDTVSRIGSKGHQLFTFDTNKVSLSPYDDKRYILDDKVTTLAYGHYKIPK